MKIHRFFTVTTIAIIACMGFAPAWADGADGSRSIGACLNHDLDGWDVLDFEISADGAWVVYRTDDYAHSGLQAIYSVPVDRSAAPVTLFAQTAGAALGFHDYQITADSTRVVVYGDLDTDGEDELYSRAIDGGGGSVKLNDPLGGWSVLDFELSADGAWVVYRTNDYGSGLDAIYSVPADRHTAPVTLFEQTGGAALGFHDYRITADSARVVVYGDLDTNDVEELYSRRIDGSGGSVKLNHDLDGWSVLDFELSADGGWVVYRADDYGSGLDAIYSVPADRLWAPEILFQQTGGAALGFHEYRITADSFWVVVYGDLDTDGVDELYSRRIDGVLWSFKLNHPLGGWSVLDFELSDEGNWVVFRANDYGSGLDAIYSTNANITMSSVTLFEQTGGAALGFHEYRITPDSARVIVRGDLDVDSVDELFCRNINGAGSEVKLNHDLQGWSVLNFEMCPDGCYVAFQTNDFAHSGLEALYSVPTDRSSAPAPLWTQTGGASMQLEEYRVEADSVRVLYRGDLRTDGETELFLSGIVLFWDGFESGNLAGWASSMGG